MRNRFAGYCYTCRCIVEVTFAYFERHNHAWRVSCVLCAARRKVADGRADCLTPPQREALEEEAN
jgi:hypothetical protein